MAKSKLPHEFVPGAYKSPMQKIGGVLSSVMSWGIRILVVVMAGWLYALTTAALMKYLGS